MASSVFWDERVSLQRSSLVVFYDHLITFDGRRALIDEESEIAQNTNKRLVSVVVMGDASPTSLVRLFFTLENVAMPGLAIPKDDFKRYSFYPLKWLRFLGYAIYGFEGDLSETEDGDTVEYSSTDLKDSYYFVSKRTCSVYIFDFDLPLLVVGGPSLVDVRSFPSATSSESDLNETFQKAVVERDINCIMTDIKANDDVRRDPCYASHIIPFIKTSDVRSFLVLVRCFSDC